MENKKNGYRSMETSDFVILQIGSSKDGIEVVTGGGNKPDIFPIERMVFPLTGGMSALPQIALLPDYKK